MPHVDPTPRHLPSPPRHLTRSRWPWRLLLVAFGLTTGVLAALVASATLLPQPSPPHQPPPSPCRPSRPSQPRPAPSPTAPRRRPPRPPLDPYLSDRAAGRQQAGQRCWTGPGPSASHDWDDHEHRGVLDLWRHQHPAPDDRPDHHARPVHRDRPDDHGRPTTTTLVTTTSTEPPPPGRRRRPLSSRPPRPGRRAPDGGSAASRLGGDGRSAPAGCALR